jgi:hypothetical protein
LKKEKSYGESLYILWHIDPLLGNDSERNEITAIARQQLRKYATGLEPVLGSGTRAIMEVLLEAVLSMDLVRGYITRPAE